MSVTTPAKVAQGMHRLFQFGSLGWEARADDYLLKSQLPLKEWSAVFDGLKSRHPAYVASRRHLPYAALLQSRQADSDTVARLVPMDLNGDNHLDFQEMRLASGLGDAESLAVLFGAGALSETHRVAAYYLFGVLQDATLGNVLVQMLLQIGFEPKKEDAEISLQMMFREKGGLGASPSAVQISKNNASLILSTFVLLAPQKVIHSLQAATQKNTHGCAQFAGRLLPPLLDQESRDRYGAALENVFAKEPKK